MKKTFHHTLFLASSCNEACVFTTSKLPIRNLKAAYTRPVSRHFTVRKWLIHDFKQVTYDSLLTAYYSEQGIFKKKQRPNIFTLTT